MSFQKSKTTAPELLDKKDEIRVASELTELLFDNSLRTNIVVLVAVLIIYFIFRDHPKAPQILIWGCFMAVFAAARLWLRFRFRSSDSSFENYNSLQQQYLLATFLVAIGWMVVTTSGVLMPEFEIKMFFVLLLVSLLGATVPALAANKTGMYAYIFVPSVPVVVALLQQGDFNAAIGFAIVIYMIMILKSGDYMHSNLVASITLRLNQEYLNNHLEQKVKDRTEELSRARDEAEKANKAKSVFLANTSHEIRTPMNVIINLSELALAEEMAPKAFDFISKVNRAGNNLLGIINDILDFSKIESGSFRIIRNSFTLSDLLKEVKEEFQPMATQKAVGFTIKIKKNVGSAYIGDELRIRQILVNIIDNAIKFTEQGEVAVTVAEVECPQRKSNLEITVDDTGIGISPDQLKELFKPFKQADDSTTRKYGGSGLGLVISKQLSELMGGGLSVYSERGVGSQFTITIPMERSDSADESDTSEHDRRKDVEEKLARVENANILIVDDIPANQLILQMLLTNIKINSVLANNGKEALRALRNGRFDMVFMDIQMPEMDGYEATQHIRSDPRYNGLPIIAMTANAMPEDIQKCSDYGMDSCLVKPINVNNVNEIVVKYLVN